MGETAHSTRSSAEGTAGGTCDSLPEQRVKRNRARRHCTEHRHRIRHHPQHATARHRPTDKSARQQDISGPKKLTQQAGLVEVDIGGDVTSKRRHGERGTRWSRTQQREPEGGEASCSCSCAKKEDKLQSRPIDHQAAVSRYGHGVDAASRSSTERDAVLFLCENKMRPGGAQVPMASHMARLPTQRHNRYLGTFQVAPPRLRSAARNGDASPDASEGRVTGAGVLPPLVSPERPACRQPTETFVRRVFNRCYPATPRLTTGTLRSSAIHITLDSFTVGQYSNTGFCGWVVYSTSCL